METEAAAGGAIQAARAQRVGTEDKDAEGLTLSATPDRAEAPTPVASRVSGTAPWRSIGVSGASLGISAGLWKFHPLLGEVIALIEISVVLIIIATALYGSKELSERAFRLLRWFVNRPEPPPPRGSRA